jgi:hypothetical protein
MATIHMKRRNDHYSFLTHRAALTHDGLKITVTFRVHKAMSS